MDEHKRHIGCIAELLIDYILAIGSDGGSHILIPISQFNGEAVRFEKMIHLIHGPMNRFTILFDAARRT